MTHKHLILDWDGVIDATWYRVTSGLDAADEFTRLHVYRTAHEGVQLLIDPTVVAKVRAWGARDDVTIHWLSARGFWVYTALAPAVGLDGFAFLPTASDSPGQEGYPYDGFYSLDWWKTVAVEKFLKQHNDLVMWVDDSISGALRHHISSLEPERLSLLVPTRRKGLQTRDLDIIDRWLNDELPTRYVTDLFDHYANQFEQLLDDGADTGDLLEKLDLLLGYRYGRR